MVAIFIINVSTPSPRCVFSRVGSHAIIQFLVMNFESCSVSQNFLEVFIDAEKLETSLRSVSEKYGVYVEFWVIGIFMTNGAILSRDNFLYRSGFLVSCPTSRFSTISSGFCLSLMMVCKLGWTISASTVLTLVCGCSRSKPKSRSLRPCAQCCCF